MDIFDAIESRRAVKVFDSNHTMSEEEIEQLLSTAIKSPTAFNIQNWRFVLVKDQTLLSQIREAASDQAQVTDSSLLIVLCADLNAWKKQPERYWKNAPQEAREFLIGLIDSYYRGREQVQRDEAMRSCGIVAQTIMLAAQGMGYDSCPMDGFDFDRVGELINLPGDHVITMMVAVGKKAQDAMPRGGQLNLAEVILTDKF